ncbi:hypothetical protein H2198_003565 [Neophaeococcomyces mojaviensis]|uniref:Uncharacterized protein n=1 Tax=Neophaeococcomyces mojaviensis TaxID=3383035 RepID=A0ACC3AB25_9EURO|nr:hypothetical protein H2198_003565 [Knufia sp. JES_112]
MDAWQDAAFSNRHLHNRIGKGWGGKGARSGATFDVTKTFGTYEVKCPSAEKISTDKVTGLNSSKLEIFRLNEKRNAIVGELTLSHVLHATVLFAGSRRIMNSVVANLYEQLASSEVDEDADVVDAVDTAVRISAESEQEDEEAEASEEQGKVDESQHEGSASKDFRTFEKNSFRSPKFWLRWQGQVLRPQGVKTMSDTVETDSGYLVFSGNDCHKFQGTISCEALGWDNVKITGWKTASKSTRDTAVGWQRN